VVAPIRHFSSAPELVEKSLLETTSDARIIGSSLLPPRRAGFSEQLVEWAAWATPFDKLGAAATAGSVGGSLRDHDGDSGVTNHSGRIVL
jgi:hypothetical protein